MSHRKLITEITPVDTNRRLKSEAVKGHYDQAQLARLADVNNLGEQSDELFQGVISDYNLDEATFFAHETGESGKFDFGGGVEEFKGYYISTFVTNMGGSAALDQEIARVKLDTNTIGAGPLALTTSITGTVSTSDSSITNLVGLQNNFATGALVRDVVADALVPLTACVLYWTNDDPANPGVELTDTIRLFIKVTQSGANNIDFAAFTRINFLVPKDATVTFTAP